MDKEKVVFWGTCWIIISCFGTFTTTTIWLEMGWSWAVMFISLMLLSLSTVMLLATGGSAGPKKHPKSHTWTITAM